MPPIKQVSNLCLGDLKKNQVECRIGQLCSIDLQITIRGSDTKDELGSNSFRWPIEHGKFRQLMHDSKREMKSTIV